MHRGVLLIKSLDLNISRFNNVMACIDAKNAGPWETGITHWPLRYT